MFGLKMSYFLHGFGSARKAGVAQRIRDPLVSREGYPDPFLSVMVAAGEVVGSGSHPGSFLVNPFQG